MKNILIVEDSLTDLKTFISLFLQKSFNISVTRNGKEALRIIDQNQPDLIILDVILPGISGFEVCNQVKTKATTNKIPIIICSVRSSELDKFWGMKQGANAYISKPIVLQTLMNTVEHLVA